MAVTNEVIGHTECPDCAAQVERRINKNRKVYWHCDGRAHDNQCNAAFKHGAAKSRRLIAEAAKSKSIPANDNQPKQETSEDEQEKNTGNSERQSAGDSNGSTGDQKSAGGFGLFGG